MVSEEKKQINTNANHKTWRQSQNMTPITKHDTFLISLLSYYISSRRDLNNFFQENKSWWRSNLKFNQKNPRNWTLQKKSSP